MPKTYPPEFVEVFVLMDLDVRTIRTGYRWGEGADLRWRIDGDDVFSDAGIKAWCHVPEWHILSNAGSMAQEAEKQAETQKRLLRCIERIRTGAENMPDLLAIVEDAIDEEGVKQ